MGHVMSNPSHTSSHQEEYVNLGTPLHVNLAQRNKTQRCTPIFIVFFRFPLDRFGYRAPFSSHVQVNNALQLCYYYKVPKHFR